jgi:hypothetical protein
MASTVPALWRFRLLRALLAAMPSVFLALPCAVVLAIVAVDPEVRAEFDLMDVGLVACLALVGLAATAGIWGGLRDAPVEWTRDWQDSPVPERLLALVEAARDLLVAVSYPLLFTAWVLVPVWVASIAGLIFPSHVGRFLFWCCDMRARHARVLGWAIPVAYGVSFGGACALHALFRRLGNRDARCDGES